ncbi:MAG: metallophosphoesterase [Polyangiaceae bacterium]
MSAPVRLGLGLLVLTTVLVLLNWLVLRRTASAFGLSARGRRWLAIGLGVPFAGTVLLRALGRWLPLGFGEPVAVAASASEMGVMIAATFLGVMALGAAGARRAARAFGGRGAETAPSTEKPAAEKPAAEKPAAEKPAAEKPAAGKPAAEKPAGAVGRAGELPSSEQAAARAEEKPSSEKPAVEAASEGLGRRAFLGRAAVGSAWAIGGGSAAYGALFGRHDYELSTVPVPIPGLSKKADGFTIVQLSDIHLGMMVGEPEMRAAEELVRKAKGDLIVLTGDLVDHDARYAEELGRLVRRLSGLGPVVAIPGNHDYYAGIDAIVATLRAAGATALVNGATLPLGEREGFVLAGLDELWAVRTGGGPDLEKALAGTPRELPRVVLCHNPKVFEETAGQIALQLSGHTHGGQVNLGVRPADLVLRHGYIAGLYETAGSHIYVNRGFGTAGPAARVGAPPEVSRIVLVAG